MDTEIFSNDEKVVANYLEAAKILTSIVSDTDNFMHFTDRISPDIVALVPSLENEDNFRSFLRLKYTYYLSVMKGKQDELLAGYKMKNEGIKANYSKIFELWDKVITREAKLLLLRYNQLGDISIDHWYNDLIALTEWLEYLLSSELNKKLECIYMCKLVPEGLKNVDYEIVHNFVLECAKEFVQLLFSNEDNEDEYLQSFICLLANKFNAKLVDHMDVHKQENGINRIEYTIASDERVRKTKNEERMRSESYSEGEGITGCLLLIDHKHRDAAPYVGSNNLRGDERQSKTHLKTHSELYGFEITDFWAFPYYDENGEIKGAFRLVNKTDDKNEQGWSYKERATVLCIIRWFESQWVDILKKIHPDKAYKFKDKENKRVYGYLNANWIDGVFFDYLLTHLKTILNKRVENHCIDVCVAIHLDQNISKFLASDNFPPYQMQPSFFTGADPEVFINGTPRPIIGKGKPEKELNDIGLMYKAMHPYTAFCLFSSAGYFHGLRQIKIDKADVPRINRVCDIASEEMSLVFLAQGDEKTIRVYKNNGLFADYYLSESDGTWRFRNFERFKDALLETKVIDGETAKLACETIFDLSFQRIGSLIIFSKSDYDFIGKNDESNLHKKLREHTYIKDVNRSVFLGWATMDGAVLCKSDGLVKYAGVILPKESSIKTEKTEKPEKTHNEKYIDKLITQHQKGSRHTTAAQYAKEHPDDCVIVVSQNKGISILQGDNPPLVWDDGFKNEGGL